MSKVCHKVEAVTRCKPAKDLLVDLLPQMDIKAKKASFSLLLNLSSQLQGYSEDVGFTPKTYQKNVCSIVDLFYQEITC